MLIIKKPINLKSRDFECTLEDSFCHRIRGNYMLFTSNLNREDLLHMVTMPPEVYLAEGNTTTFIQHHSLHENKEVKIDILNNLLNRISYKEELQLSYQDRVYIDVALRKLGIYDTKEFLSQISQVKVQNELMEKKINQFWQVLHQSQSSEIDASTVTEGEKLVYEEQTKEERNYLYEEIMNRLHTGLLYQIMDNFSSAQVSHANYFSNQKLLLSQQKKTARQIFLNQLENHLSQTEIPFVYLEENRYEQIEMISEEKFDERVNNQISKAVLYQLINSMHLEKLTRTSKSKDFWLDTKFALYQTAENTLFRMQNEVIREGEKEKREQLYLRLQKDREEAVRKEMLYQQELAELIHQEKVGEAEEEGGTSLPMEEEGASTKQLKGIEQVVFAYLEKQLRLTSFEVSKKKLDELYHQRIQSEQFNQHRGEENLSLTHHKLQEVIKTLEEEVVEQEEEKRVRMELIEQIHRLSEEIKQTTKDHHSLFAKQEFRRIEEAVKKTLDKAQIEEQKETINSLSREEKLVLEYIHPAEERKEAEKEKQGQLEDLPEKSKQIYQLLEEYTTSSREVTEKSIFPLVQQELHYRDPDRQEEKKQGLGEEFFSTVKEERTQELKEEQKVKSIQEDPELIREMLQKINEKNLQKMEYYQILKQQNERRQEMQKKSPEEIRKEGLQALTNPEELLLQYRLENEQRQGEEQKEKRKLLEGLPKETREIYRLVEAYRQNPEGGKMAGISKDNLGLLIRDSQIIREDYLGYLQEDKTNEGIKEEISHEVWERWKKNEAQPKLIQQEAAMNQDVQLVHKQTQQILEEDQLQELLAHHREQIVHKQTEEVVVKKQKQIKAETIQEKNVIRKRTNEELAQMIDHGVKKQIGNISEQVYQRLEKKLYYEKRRRGI